MMKQARFLDWYLKIGIGSAIVGGGMEFFMINTGFSSLVWFILVLMKTLGFYLPKLADDKVTVLEAEKRAYENSPEAQAVREALNPWRNKDAEATKTPP
uniref:Uncharacterized protein n=1 Tax=Brassica campestris TaxID=3711 RepID=M4CTY7_BRACM